MSADAVATLAALAALGLALLGPGALLVELAGLGRTALERFGLAVACGRILLGVVTLALASTGGLSLLPWLAVGATSAWAILAVRACRRTKSSVEPREAWAALAPVGAALLLGALVVFRSGGLDASGDLVFHGKDAVNDPLFYIATATRLSSLGLPMQNPFVADFPIVGHELFFGAVAGIEAVGATLASSLLATPPESATLVRFAVLFRALPLIDLIGLGLAAFSLARVLGATTTAAALSGVLVLLGGEAFALVRLAAGFSGLEARDVLAWSFFGPLLVPVNPVASAMQALFVAVFLLARLPDGGTRSAVAAGILVGASAELKLFAWAAAFPALLGVALLAAPRPLVRPVRIAALFAFLATLPSLLEKLGFTRLVGDRFTVGFSACPGCLPRHLLDTTFGSGDFSFQIFDAFRGRDLLDPGRLAGAALASAAVLAIVLGARLLAIPALLRGCGAPSPGPALGHRLLAATSLAGLLLALTIGTPPHHLNAGQFAWPALFALSLELGIVLGGWLTARRVVAVIVTLGIALFSPALTLWRMGLGAPVLLRTTADERALLRALAQHARPEDVVLEPSWLQHPDLPAPAAWLAGRQAYLSTESQAAYLPSWERLFRSDVLRRVFHSRDGASAARAIDASRARWVLAPIGFPLRFDPQPTLEAVFTNEAGTLYRVRDPADASSS